MYIHITLRVIEWSFDHGVDRRIVGSFVTDDNVTKGKEEFGTASYDTIGNLIQH